MGIRHHHYARRDKGMQTNPNEVETMTYANADRMAN